MKKTVFTLISAFVMLSSQAQFADTTYRPHSAFKQYMPQDELDKFNLRQQKISRRGMYALAGWALANGLYGSIASSQSSGETQVFHASNAIWGGINLLIATPGILASYQTQKMKNLSFGKTTLQQHGIEKIFLINAGLDFAYIGAGAAAWGFSDRVSSQKTKNILSGGGKSFIVQGGFLLLFDWTMYIVHSQHAFRNLNRYTAGLAYTGNGLSYTLAF